MVRIWTNTSKSFPAADTHRASLVTVSHFFDLDHFYCHQFFGPTQHESTISHSLLGTVLQHTANRCRRGESFLMLHISSG